MKNKLLFISFCVILSTSAKAQFTFGISPGISFNSAYFGYKVNKNILPFAGLQFGNLSYNFTESGIRNDMNGNLEEYNSKTELKAGIYIINLGAKHYFKPTNKLKPYTLLNIAKPILSGKFTDEDAEFEKEVNDQFKNIKLWGGEVGFGTEYMFDENFSIGGEFGIRHLNVNIKNTRTDEVFDPVSGNSKDVEIVTDIKTRFNPTFTRFSLNFYF